MRNGTFTLLFFSLLCICCKGSVSSPISSCEAAQERLKALDCRFPNGQPMWETPQGRPFKDACENARKTGRDWNPETIFTCEDI